MGLPSPNGNKTNSFIYCSGTSRKEGGKLQEPQYQEVCNKTSSSRNGCIKKTERMAISMGILTWLEEQLDKVQQTVAAERTSLSQGWTPYWLSNEEWSALKSYTHKQQKWIQQVAFLDLYMHLHICMCTYVYTCIYIYVYATITKRTRLSTWEWRGVERV